MKHKCYVCNKDSVRLYRSYGTFFRESTVFCNEHVPEKSRGWYVPLCTDVDGTVWGYTSVPDSAIDEFYSLPEANNSYPVWLRRNHNRHNGWSNEP